MIRYLRPIIAIGLMLAFVGIGTAFVFMGKADGNSFMRDLANTFGMIVAFIFGERSQAKKTEGHE